MEMVAKKVKKGEGHSNPEFLENPEVLAEQFSRTEEYVSRNKTLLIAIGGGLALAIAAFFGYKYLNETKNIKGQNEMFQAVYYFEQDSLSLALNGDGQYLGLVDIAEEYSGTDAGNLANYYAGVAYLKKGNFDAAILYLEDFSSNDLLIQAKAYNLIGDAHMELGNYDDAANFYAKAADYKPNEFFTPQYLMKEALAYEKANNLEAAKKAYQEIINEYPGSTEYSTAIKYRARLK